MAELTISADEIRSAIEGFVSSYTPEATCEEVGIVAATGAGIATILMWGFSSHRGSKVSNVTRLPESCIYVGMGWMGYTVVFIKKRQHTVGMREFTPFLVGTASNAAIIMRSGPITVYTNGQIFV